MPSPLSKRLSVFSSVVTDNIPHSSFLMCSALTHCLNLARQWLHSHSLSPVQQTACCKLTEHRHDDRLSGIFGYNYRHKSWSTADSILTVKSSSRNDNMGIHCHSYCRLTAATSSCRVIACNLIATISQQHLSKHAAQQAVWLQGCSAVL